MIYDLPNERKTKPVIEQTKLEELDCIGTIDLYLHIPQGRAGRGILSILGY